MMTGITLRKVLVSAATLTALVLGACADERRDHPVFLDDLNDLGRFPNEDRRRLQSEREQLPISVVRVPVDDEGNPRADAQAEVRHLSRDVELQRLEGERLASAWSEGRSSNRARLAHNVRHVGDDYKHGRRYSTQHDLDDHSYGHGGRYRHHHKRHWRHNHRGGHRYHHRGYRHYRYNTPLTYSYRSYPTTTYWYRYYQPYYRSSYYPNVYWGGYRFYNTYYQPSGYRYYVYYPSNSYYSNYYTY